jgi:hypothetical protein
MIATNARIYQNKSNSETGVRKKRERFKDSTKKQVIQTIQSIIARQQ